MPNDLGQIELFHKVLKSGCRAEGARLRTAERLVNLLALFCILSWRLFWLTMLNRAAPDASPRLALTKGEVCLLDRMAGRPSSRSPPTTLSSYLTQIARLGGYLARASDPPPGNTVMWRGWSGSWTSSSVRGPSQGPLVGNCKTARTCTGRWPSAIPRRR